ncbi:hypothetical protein Bhyg_03078, partial [Pseudolycoriella hygida]
MEEEEELSPSQEAILLQEGHEVEQMETETTNEQASEQITKSTEDPKDETTDSVNTTLLTDESTIMVGKSQKRRRRREAQKMKRKRMQLEIEHNRGGKEAPTPDNQGIPVEIGESAAGIADKTGDVPTNETQRIGNQGSENPPETENPIGLGTPTTGSVESLGAISSGTKKLRKRGRRRPKPIGRPEISGEGKAPDDNTIETASESKSEPKPNSNLKLSVDEKQEPHKGTSGSNTKKAKKVKKAQGATSIGKTSESPKVGHQEPETGTGLLAAADSVNNKKIKDASTSTEVKTKDVSTSVVNEASRNQDEDEDEETIFDKTVRELPYDDDIELMKFEENFTDPKFCSKMQKNLKKIGGANPSKVVNNILRAIATKNALKKFVWDANAANSFQKFKKMLSCIYSVVC